MVFTWALCQVTGDAEINQAMRLRISKLRI